MVIDQRPVALDRRSRISAETAQYFIKRDLVELRGAPVLEHWQDGRSKAGNAKSPAPLPLKVKAQWVDWKPERAISPHLRSCAVSSSSNPSQLQPRTKSQRPALS